MTPYRIPFAKLELLAHMIQQGGSFICPIERTQAHRRELSVTIEHEQGGKHFTASFPYMGKLQIIRIPVTGSAHLALAEWIEDAVNGRLDADEMREASEAYAEQDHIEEVLDMVPDMVNHPPHYTGHPSGVECIEVTEHLPFCLGNAFKYLFRRDAKGNQRENLEKALWYIRREADAREHVSLYLIAEATAAPMAHILAHEPAPWCHIMEMVGTGRMLDLAADMLAAEIAKLDA